MVFSIIIILIEYYLYLFIINFKFNFNNNKKYAYLLTKLIMQMIKMLQIFPQLSVAFSEPMLLPYHAYSSDSPCPTKQTQPPPPPSPSNTHKPRHFARPAWLLRDLPSYCTASVAKSRGSDEKNRLKLIILSHFLKQTMKNHKVLVVNCKYFHSQTTFLCMICKVKTIFYSFIRGGITF